MENSKVTGNDKLIAKADKALKNLLMAFFVEEVSATNFSDTQKNNLLSKCKKLSSLLSPMVK